MGPTRERLWGRTEGRKDEEKKKGCGTKHVGSYDIWYDFMQEE